MTAICGGGPSQPIPGKQTEFYLTGGALALIAQFLGIGWLAEVLGYIAGINFVLSDICNTDPPADPGVTAQDIACIFAPGNPFCDSGVSIAKVAQLITRMAWSQWCQCVSGPASPLPTAPSAPSGLIQINPPSIITPGIPGLCSDLTEKNVGNDATTTVTAYHNESLPGLNVTPSWSTTPLKYLPVPKPAQVQFTLTVNNDGTNNDRYICEMVGRDGSSSALYNLGQVVGLAPFGQASSTLTNIPDAVVALQVGITKYTSNAQNNTVNVETKLYCPGNAVGGPSTLGCCPPPADLVSAVNDIHTLVTYLQRYTLPFAYINGAVHSNLSGTGSFAISRLIGVHIHIVSTSSAQGVEAANPNQLFNAGFVSILDADGGIDERRIRYTDDVWMPRHFQEAITFGYFLEPGVVATFTELEAEP